jgi:hypothetical protein
MNLGVRKIAAAIILCIGPAAPAAKGQHRGHSLPGADQPVR